MSDQTKTLSVIKKANALGFDVDLMASDDGAVQFTVKKSGLTRTRATLRTAGELLAWLQGVEYGRKRPQDEDQDDG